MQPLQYKKQRCIQFAKSNYIVFFSLAPATKIQVFAVIAAFRNVDGKKFGAHNKENSDKSANKLMGNWNWKCEFFNKCQFSQ